MPRYHQKSRSDRAILSNSAGFIRPEHGSVTGANDCEPCGPSWRRPRGSTRTRSLCSSRWAAASTVPGPGGSTPIPRAKSPSGCGPPGSPRARWWRWRLKPAPNSTWPTWASWPAAPSPRRSIPACRMKNRGAPCKPAARASPSRKTEKASRRWSGWARNPLHRGEDDARCSRHQGHRWQPAVFCRSLRRERLGL